MRAPERERRMYRPGASVGLVAGLTSRGRPWRSKRVAEEPGEVRSVSTEMMPAGSVLIMMWASGVAGIG